MKSPLAPASIIIAQLLLILTSCTGIRLSRDQERGVYGSPANAGAVSAGTQGAYPPWRGAVTVYHTREEIEGLRCEKLGLVTARSPYTYESDRAELVSQLQYQAANLGANAILLLEQDNEKDRLAGRLKAQALRVIDRSML